MRHTALALLILACNAQAAPRCDAVSVEYSAPRLVPLAGHVSVKRLVARPERELDDSDPEYKPRSPHDTAAFHRLVTIDSTKEGVPRVNSIEIYTLQGPKRAWRLDFAELAQNVEVQWLNEDLLFLRAWWGRIVSTELLFEVSSGRFLYAKEANYGLMIQPCEELQAK
ncbi:hypothetical protein [Roseateles sp. P5_E4]